MMMVAEYEPEHIEKRRQIFRTMQGTKTRKHGKRGGCSVDMLSLYYTGSVQKCERPYGRTSHERKLHREAIHKQTRFTREGCYKLTW